MRDLKGHLGRVREVIGKAHEGWGMGERNEERERGVDLSIAFATTIHLLSEERICDDLLEWP